MSNRTLIDKVDLPEAEFGPWKITKFNVTKDDSMWTSMRAARDGRGYVPEGTYTKLFCAGRGTIMSDTPDEMRDHYDAVRNAVDHVLINGLGLGMVLAAVLKKPEVTHVTVIELDPDIVAHVGPFYTCDRLEIVQASAYDYKPPKNAVYGAVWHDIWDGLCVDNLPQMTTLKRKYGRRTAWQGCWGEEFCRRHQKQEKKGRYW